MTKTVQEQIKEHEQAIEKLKAVERKALKPEWGDDYAVLTGYGDVQARVYIDDNYDKGRLAIGNCFRTELEAERARDNLKTIKAIKDWIAENDIEALSLDWNDADVPKFSFCYNHRMKKVFIHVYRVIQYSQLPHFSSKEKAEACLEFIGENKIAALYGVYDEAVKDE